MGKMFKDTVARLEANAGSQSIIEWEFDELTKEGIATYEVNGVTKFAVSASCGCTTPTVLDDRIQVTYQDGGNDRGVTVTKSVFVYYPDGDTPVWVENKKKEGHRINPDLPRTQLKFHVNIL